MGHVDVQDSMASPPTPRYRDTVYLHGLNLVFIHSKHRHCAASFSIPVHGIMGWGALRVYKKHCKGEGV